MQFGIYGESSVKVELISLVIPCDNEEATIQEFYGRASTLAESMMAYRFEFLNVSDGSTDDEVEIYSAEKVRLE